VLADEARGFRAFAVGKVFARRAVGEPRQSVGREVTRRLAAMIAAGRAYVLDQWWVAAAPGAAIFIVSLAFNLLGDGLRDALDPRAAS
jgi:hypothetical protein